MTAPLLMNLSDIQPSQLYISSEKLAEVTRTFDPRQPESLEPVPVKELGGQVVYTDGHTRAFAAFQAGWLEIPVVWDTDELDWEAYRICVDWCKAAGIRTIADLAGRVIDAGRYETLWHERCRRMHRHLAAKRKRKLGENDHGTSETQLSGGDD